MDPFVLWITGLPGAGKTTIAARMRPVLEARGYRTVHIDADKWWKVVHKHIDSDHNTDARWRNIKALVQFCASLLELGYVVITDTVAPIYDLRKYARDQLGKEHKFFEVLLRCPMDVCERRKPEGYAKARSGEFKSYPGVHVPYEHSPDYDLVVPTAAMAEDTTVLLVDEMLKDNGMWG